MARNCARPACNAPAVATFTFDGLNRILWLSPLAEAAAYSAGDLCGRHADLLRPPLRWEVRDTRVAVTNDAAGPSASAPSRHLPPPDAPAPTRTLERVGAARAPVPATAAAASTERTTHRPERPASAVPVIPRAGPPPELDAHTPLLERAFRAANIG
jgi:hypothetical protein